MDLIYESLAQLWVIASEMNETQRINPVYFDGYINALNDVKNDLDKMRDAAKKEVDVRVKLSEIESMKLEEKQIDEIIRKIKQKRNGWRK